MDHLLLFPDAGDRTGKIVLPLSHRWTATVLQPDAGRIFLGLSCDGRLLTILGEPGDDAPPRPVPVHWGLLPHVAVRYPPDADDHGAGKYTIRLSRRLAVTILEPVDGYVAVGFFWEGELLGVVDEPLGNV